MGGRASGKWKALLVLHPVLDDVSSLALHFRPGICPCSPHRKQPSPRGDTILGGDETPGQEGLQPLGDSICYWDMAFHTLVKALPF